MKRTSKGKAEGFYRRLLAEAARSGLPLRQFAAERGVPAGTLSCWRFKLKQLDAERKTKVEAARFVPVRVLDEPAARTESTVAERSRPRVQGAASSYEVVLGRGRVLRLPPDFEGAQVAALIQAVEASC